MQEGVQEVYQLFMKNIQHEQNVTKYGGDYSEDSKKYLHKFKTLEGMLQCQMMVKSHANMYLNQVSK